MPTGTGLSKFQARVPRPLHRRRHRRAARGDDGHRASRMGGHPAGRRDLLDVPPAGVRSDRPRRLPERHAGGPGGRPRRACGRGRHQPSGDVHVARAAAAAEPGHREPQGRAGAPLPPPDGAWRRTTRSRCTTHATRASAAASEPEVLPVGRGRGPPRGHATSSSWASGRSSCAPSRSPTRWPGDGWSIGVINARFAKPLDRQLILDAGTRQAPVVTFEESVVTGGFGSAVLEAIEDARAHRSGAAR